MRKNPLPHIAAAGRGRGSDPTRGNRVSGRSNSALSHQNPSFGYSQSHGPTGSSNPYMAGPRQPGGPLAAPLQRWVTQDPGVEPVNVQPQMMGYGPRGASNTDLTLASDLQNSYDPNLLSLDISGVSPVHSTHNFQLNPSNQRYNGWPGGFPMPPVPAPQTHPDLMPAPSIITATSRTSNIAPDAAGEPNQRKRARPSSSNLDTLTIGHRYFNLFNYEEYTPPKSTKGNPMGTRSLDHHPDSDLDTTYASYRFQNDPIKYWILRDVAEKVPTKIREKEIAFFKQLGATAPDENLVESKGKNIVDVTLKMTGEALKKPFKRKDKRVKMGTAGGSIKKGRRNWIDNYKEKFPNKPLPSSVPNWRPTVHAVLHAGKSDQGPQDFNSLFLNTFRRCEDPEFLSLMIQKLETYRDMQHYSVDESESAEQSDIVPRSFDSQSQHGALSETDASTHAHRVSRNTSIRSNPVFNQNPQREPSNTNSMSQDFAHFSQMQTQPISLQTAMQQNYYTDNTTRATSGSGTNNFLSPTNLHGSGLYNGDLHGRRISDEISSFMSSNGDPDHGVYSQPATTVPEMTDAVPAAFTEAAGDVDIDFPYPEKLDTDAHMG